MSYKNFTALVIGASLTFPMIASAQETAGASEQGTGIGIISDAAQRINLAGKLRMLSQRIASTACYDHAGIATDVSEPMLVAATAETDQILDALLYGDEALGIFGEENDRQIMADIDEAHLHWDPLHIDIEDIVATGGTDEEVIHISSEADELLKIAAHLTSIVTGEYSDPNAIAQADALTIDIAGRQRMLAQRISKDVCLLTTNIHMDGITDDLASTISMYENSVNALRNGFPNAGIVPPPSDEIAAGLDAVIADWSAIQPILTAVIEGAEISAEDQALIFAEMNSLTGQMNTIVGLYVQ